MLERKLSAVPPAVAIELGQEGPHIVPPPSEVLDCKRDSSSTNRRMVFPSRQRRVLSLVLF